MKKFLSIALASVMALSLAACGGAAPESSDSTASGSEKKYIIATPRNSIMSQLISSNTILLETNRSIGDSGYLWGWDITFDYKGKTYCWDAWGNLKYYSEKRPQVKISAVDVESFLKLLNS